MVFGVKDLDYSANSAWFLKNCGLMVVELLLHVLVHRLASLLFSLFLLFNSFVTYIIKLGLTSRVYFVMMNFTKFLLHKHLRFFILTFAA